MGRATINGLLGRIRWWCCCCWGNFKRGCGYFSCYFCADHHGHCPMVFPSSKSHHIIINAHNKVTDICTIILPCPRAELSSFSVHFGLGKLAYYIIRYRYFIPHLRRCPSRLPGQARTIQLLQCYTVQGHQPLHCGGGYICPDLGVGFI